MTAMVIDTLQFSKRMQNVGLNQKIAEELAEAIKDSTSISTENIPTKQDLQAVKNDVEIVNKDIKAVETNLRQEIKSVETNLRQEIKITEQRIIIKLGILMSVLFTIFTGIISSLIAFH
jgi:hypothetical protein